MISTSKKAVPICVQSLKMLCTQDPCFDHFIKFLFLEWLAYPSSYSNIPLETNHLKDLLNKCEIFQIPKLHFYV